MCLFVRKLLKHGRETPHLELTIGKQLGLFIRGGEVEHFHQLFVLGGLGEMRIESRFLTALLIEVMSPAGKRDQKHTLSPGLLADHTGSFVAAKLWHRNIEYHDLWTELRSGFDRFHSVPRDLYYVSVLAQKPRENFGGLGKIVSHQNSPTLAVGNTAVFMSWCTMPDHRAFGHDGEMNREFAASVQAITANFDFPAMHLNQPLH